MREDSPLSLSPSVPPHQGSHCSWVHTASVPVQTSQIPTAIHSRASAFPIQAPWVWWAQIHSLITSQVWWHKAGYKHSWWGRRDFNEGFSHTMKSWPQDMISGISCRQKWYLSWAEEISWKMLQSLGVRWYDIFVFQTVCHRQWGPVRVGLTGVHELWPVSHLPWAQTSWCMQPHFSKE